MSFPVVITAPVSAELINDFLTEAHKFNEAGQPSSLVILTTKDWCYYDHEEHILSPSEQKEQGVYCAGGKPMKVPSEEPWTEEVDSPFLGLTPLQVAHMLREEAKFPRYDEMNPHSSTKVDTDWCAILDEQTVRDRSTALLVHTTRTEGENLPEHMDHVSIVEHRMKWEDVEQSLMAWSVGASSIEEVVWNVNDDCDHSRAKISSIACM